MVTKIVACGSYLPPRIVSNTLLSKSIDTNDEWIKSRTGIAQRHIAGEDECVATLAIKASIEAIKKAQIDSDDIDLIIVCSTTNENSFPSIANKLQGYLQIKNIPSFDLQAACSGFLYGLQVADSFIKSKHYKTILLVCAEKMSRILDWQDRRTCVLFGDGAGAVILQRCEEGSKIIDSKLYSNGYYHDILFTDEKNGGKIKMDGSKVFKQAVIKISESINEIIEKNNINVSDIKYFIPHQANIRILQSVASHVGIDENRMISTLSNHANCSAASIPLALADVIANEQKEYEVPSRGDLLLFTAFGAGMTWGSALVKW